MDLTPRTFGDTPDSGAPDPAEIHRPSVARRIRTAVLVALVVAALGVVLVRGLGNAALFFYNVDEAVARQGELGEQRFRLQGTVDDGSIARAGGVASFFVTYNGVHASVRHQGEVPKMFQPGIPVVLEGRWQAGTFASDRMLVKHSEVYIAENPQRVDDYAEEPSETDPR